MMSERERMLSELLAELDRTRRGRIVRKRVGVGFSVCAMVLVTAAVAYMGTATRRVPSQSSPSLVQSVGTDPGVMARYVVEPPSAPALTAIVRTSDISLAGIEMLDDHQLCHVLASIGRPAGIVRSQGKVWLTGAVTDAELPQGG